MDFIGKKIDNRFKILKKIGEGSFGVVYKAKDLISKHKVALKIETNSQGRNQILNEIQAYTHLSNIEGIPSLLGSGRINDLHYCAIDLLESSISKLLKERKGKISLGCALNISFQLLERLEKIHNSSYIHRDIKPSNLMTGRHKNSKMLYLIDFGLSKKYRDPTTKQHSLYGEDRQMIGNMKYSSLNTHLGVEQSRRDDLESWFYLTINIIKGKLPWEDDLLASNLYMVLKIKSHLTMEELCKDCPEEFLDIIRHIKGLHFEECPKYELLKSSLRLVIQKYNLAVEFDWVCTRVRRTTGGLLSVKKPKDVRRKSECNLGQILNLTQEVKIQSSNSPSINSQESSIGVKIKKRRSKKMETKNSNASRDTSHRGQLSLSSINEEIKEQTEYNQLERVDTIKNIYPAFRKKHVNFVEVDSPNCK